ncbi:anion permease [bacterium]|nr:anion permease [bacterium]NBW57722.1 anion permease [bacterium]NBX71363.1 anion permease [bacterium]
MLSNQFILLILSSVIAFMMAVAIGANDVSNAVGTAVGARAITIRQALLIAVVFEFLGAAFAGGEVSTTIAEKLYVPDAFILESHVIIFIMIASLLASGTWLMIATYCAWPVSTTHTLLGALILLGSITLGKESINWDKVYSIGLAWLASPIVGGLLSYGIFKVIQLGIVHQQNCSKRFFVYLSLPFFLINMIWAFTLVNIISKLFHIALSRRAMLVAPIILSLICYAIFFMFFYKKYKKIFIDTFVDPAGLDKAFNSFMMITACCMAYAHGSNDIANAIGPLMAINQLLFNLPIQETTPLWVLLIGIAGVVIGLLVWGHRVIETIGNNITELSSSRGFAASLATAFTVLLSSHFGYPISTTHTLVGAILGVGFARGIESLNVRMIRSILLSWTITFPAGGVIALFFYIILKYTLSSLLVF